MKQKNKQYIFCNLNFVNCPTEFLSDAQNEQLNKTFLSYFSFDFHNNCFNTGEWKLRMRKTMPLWRDSVVLVFYFLFYSLWYVFD